ncbi:MAG TPA: nitrate/nitrite transporter [Candidatus Azoamicus sp. OHIO2]
MTILQTQTFNLNDYTTKYDTIRALAASTFAFTICFAVWTIFSIIGVKIKYEIGLSDTQFGILISTPILTGSLSRLFLGILAEQYGGRIILTGLMIISAICTWILTYSNSYYEFLIIALGVGLAGGSFSVGVTYVSKWFDKDRQGTALGIFGMGNFGSAITNLFAPFLLYLGWQGVVKIYAVSLLCSAILFFLFTKTDPTVLHRHKFNIKFDNSIKQLEPLKNLQVWRFSFYYFFVFGAFVALALWLPRYYVGVYGLDIKTAGMLTALFSFPGSVFRALGGWMSDKIGARKILYYTFIFSCILLFILSYPSTNYLIQGINGDINFSLQISLPVFVSCTFILGFFMSLGKGAVYKHIPIYYSANVGSVGGIVGLIGGLGGFTCPIIFGILNDMVGIWTSCFMFLFLIAFFALIWMHFSILYINKKQSL